MEGRPIYASAGLEVFCAAKCAAGSPNYETCEFYTISCYKALIILQVVIEYYRVMRMATRYVITAEQKAEIEQARKANMVRYILCCTDMDGRKSFLEAGIRLTATRSA